MIYVENRFTYRDMVKLVRNSIYTTIRNYYPPKVWIKVYKRGFKEEVSDEDIVINISI